MRFIPVYTGNTSGFRYNIVFITGLSLCIQGTHLWAQEFELKWRFIPVYTGNTGSGNNLEITLPVYPCVYREHANEFLAASLEGGLSLCIQGTRMKRKITKKRRPVYPCVYREHFT